MQKNQLGGTCSTVYRVRVAKECVVSQLNTVLCVAQKKQKSSALGTVDLTDSNRAVTFRISGGISLVSSGTL